MYASTHEARPKTPVVAAWIRMAMVLAGLLVGCTQTPRDDGGGSRPEAGSGGDPDGGGAPDMTNSADMTQPTRSVLIDFDNISGNVTDQYKSDAVFSTTMGQTNTTLGYGAYFMSSPPNILCGTGSCAEPTYVDFTRPVSKLTFRAVGVTNSGPIAEVNVFVRGTKKTTVPIVGISMNTTPVLVDLSAHSDVTRIEIVNITDSQGIGYDDFKFMTY